MYFITRAYNTFYKCFSISIISIFLILLSISPCQADWSIKRLELAEANSSEETRPPTWNQAGRSAYESAAEIMKTRSPEGVQLEERIKVLLASHFEDLVMDDITVHWDTLLLIKWEHPAYSNDYDITLKGLDTQAQTYGNDIYIKYSRSELDGLDLIVLLVHQMKHVQQFHESGSFSEFGYDYYKGYKDGDKIYEKNEMETNADSLVKTIIPEIVNGEDFLQRLTEVWEAAAVVD